MVNYSRIIGEVMVLMKKPSVFESPLRQSTRTCPDGILQRQKLAAVEKYFRWSPYFLWYFRKYIVAKPRAKEPQGAHKPGGRYPPGRTMRARGVPGGLCPDSPAPRSFFVPEKIFLAVSFRLDSVHNPPLKGVKNMEKTGTGTWHWVNKLVPKNI